MKGDPWAVGRQVWDNVLFMHWSVPAEILNPYIPAPFTLDTYNGKSWISVVLLRSIQSRFRGMPVVMSYPSYLQINVRTYIRCNGEQGIYFLTVNVDDILVKTVAQKIIQLPYHLAVMEIKNSSDHLTFSSKPKESESPLDLTVNYRPTTQEVPNQQGTLAHWLTERYYFWTIKGDKIIRGSISHVPWELYDVEVKQDMSGVIPIVPDLYFQKDPVVHYTKSMDTYLYPFEQAGIYKKFS